MATDKRTILLISGTSAQSTGQTLKYLDPDTKGLDDKMGTALDLIGSTLIKYALGDIKGWRGYAKMAGQTLIEMAGDESIGPITNKDGGA